MPNDGSSKANFNQVVLLRLDADAGRRLSDLIKFLKDDTSIRLFVKHTVMRKSYDVASWIQGRLAACM